MNQPWFKLNSYLLKTPLTLLGALLFVVAGSRACQDLYTYFRLSAKTQAEVERWVVIKKSSSSYPIQGFYRFEFQGKKLGGSSLLPPPHHLNCLSAEKYAKILEKKSVTVWFDPHHPRVSSLEKKLPSKKIIYTLCTLGITLYFYWIETHSSKRSSTN